MPRIGALRAGYALLGLAIVALVGSYVEALAWAVLLAPLFALVGALCLVFSRDDVPKYAGLALLAYALLTLLAFAAATPATIRLSFWKGFANPDPPAAARALIDYLVLVLPIMVATTAAVAAWERENGARLLLAGSAVGLLLVAIVSVAVTPGGTAASDTALNASDPRASEDILEARSAADRQAALLKVLVVLSTACGVAGAAWAAVRPDEYH